MAVIYITEADSTLHKFRLPEDPSVVVTIGREESCAISLPTILGLSGLHCSIVRVDDTYVVTDEGSTNGTYEGERAISSEPLCAGAVYSIGNAALTFDPEIPVALPVVAVEPEMEAPAAPAEAIVSDDVVDAVPEVEAPAAPAEAIVSDDVVVAVPEVEAPAAPAEAIVSDDVVVAVPEVEAPAAPAEAIVSDDVVVAVPEVEAPAAPAEAIVSNDVVVAVPEVEAPAAPAEAIVSDDVVDAAPEEEAPAAPAPGASRSKRDLILPGVLLAAGIGMGAYAAWLACADMGKQSEHFPLAQEEVLPSEGASAPVEQAGKVSHVGHIACGSRVDSIAFSPDSRALIT